LNKQEHIVRNQTKHEKGELSMVMRVNQRLARMAVVLLASTWAFVAPAAAPKGNSPAQTPVRDMSSCLIGSNRFLDSMEGGRQ